MFSSNTTQVSAVTQAEAVDFSGNYLSKASDLTGNADGKAFTFSFWVWLNDLDGSLIDNGNSRLVVRVNSGQINIYGKNTSDVDVLYFNTDVIPQNTWTHILVSLDLASTSNRYVYINDVQQTISWTTYTNTNVDRASTGTWYAPTPGLSTRVSNLFMDYTYRNLSIEANRRLFVTADLKPASGQSALNPILYFKMDDPTTVATNSGTGGNFTLTGTVARSGRGPNQYNAPYSDLDGTADYLSRTTAPTGIADGKQFTFQCVFNVDSSTTNYSVVTMASSTSERLSIQLYGGGVDGGVNLYARNSAGTLILNAAITAPLYVAGRNIVLSVSIDLSDTAKRFVYINGTAATVTWNTYTNADIDFAITTTPRYYIGVGPSLSSYLNGRLGAFWFNTSYIDLSVASNLAKFVSGTGINAKPVDLGATGELPTGTAPLIYLPMYGNNAGKNYGTGGDFTVNSGPYTGARGPNEFWGNKAIFNGSSSKITRSAMSGVSASKTVSGCFWIQVANFPASQAGVLYGDYGLQIRVTSTTSQPLTFSATNSSSSIILSVQTNTSTFSTTPYYCVQYCFDMTSSAKRFVYINGVSQSLIVSTYTNANIAHNLMAPIIGWNNGSGYLNGGLAEMYMTTEYIDFSLESNRLKFCDAFGNPVDLSAQITAAAIPTPAIYMRFPPTSFGTNTGTGGDFTPTSITDGGQL